VRCYNQGCGAEEEEEQCAVCRMEFDKGETVRMLPACGHVYHTECLAPWLADNKCCPICKTDVVP
jgi:E3 ubiquitin-protein ligase BIG BROTHER-like protein